MLTSLYRRTGVALLVLALIITLFSSLRIGLSSIYNSISETELNRWTNEKDRVVTEWPTVESNLSMSTKLYPNNPSIASNLGRLHQYRDLGTALMYYRKASKLRPSQGLTWAMIVELKFSLGEIDSEFTNALENAASWGPWEPNVQSLTVNAGLRAWPHLDQDARLNIRQFAIRGMLSPRNRNIMGRLLTKHEFLPLVCPHLPKTPVYSKYCRTR
jgi:hypothetical protein